MGVPRCSSVVTSPQILRNISFGAFFFLGLVCLVPTGAAQTEARTHLQKQTEAASVEENLQQHYDAGRTFQLTGDQERAASEYKVFLSEALRQIANVRAHAENLDEAEKLFSESVMLNPDSAQANLDYAAFRLQQENPKGAQVLAENAVRLAPSNAQAQYLLGSAMFQQQNYQGAKEHLEKAVVADPKFEVGYLLGMTYVKLNDLNRATLLFNEMVAGLGDSAEIHVLFGRAYREGDFLDQAISELKKAITKENKIKVAHYLLAMAYLERDGDSGFAEAVPELESELKVNPDDVRTHYMLGYIALKRRDVKVAEEELVKAAKLDSENPDPLVSLGQLYFDAGRLAEAEKTFRRAILVTKDPSRNGYQINRVHYGLGRLLLQTGREEEGKKELQISAELRDKPRAEGRGDRQTSDAAAMEHASSAAAMPKPNISPDELKKVKALFDELTPAIADSYNNLGVIAAGRKDFISALDYFSHAGIWNPGLETLDRNLGMAAFYANQYDRAVGPLNKHLEQQPDDLRARAALGLSLFGIQNYAKVLEILQPIQKEVTDDPGLSYAYAVSQVKTGAYAEGVSRLRTLEKNDPGSADIHTLLGQAFGDQGEYGEALKEYRSALAINPNLERAHFLTGLALLRQGDPAGAADELRVALKLDPTDVSSKYHLAFSLIQIQHQQEAVPLLQEVIQQDPKHGDAYYQLGKLQLDRGDTRGAISNLEAGTRLNPDRDYMHYQLALAYRREARGDDAEREMKVYRALKNGHRGGNASREN